VVIILIVVLTVLYYYLPVIQRLRNLMVFKSLTKESEETIEATRKSFECPMCGRDMNRGYLVSSSPIFWSSRTSYTQFLPRFLSRDPMTFSTRIPGLTPSSSLEAYRCGKCGIIYVDTRQGRIPEVG